MSAARAKLKQIQKSLKEEDYEAVVTQTKELLKEEKGQGQNVYNALVFAGVALSKLTRNEEAEKVYLQATRLFPDLPLAFQGITKLYTATEQWDKLAQLLQSQVIHSVQDDDAEGCARHLQNLLQLQQEHGSDKQVTFISNRLLPASPIYDLLLRLPRLGDNSSVSGSHADGHASYTPWTPPDFPSPPSIHELPLASAPPATAFQFATAPPYPTPFPPVNQVIHHPDTALALLLTNTLKEEIEERQREEKEVQTRRKRLGAGGEKEVRRAVGRDVLASSKLPDYYEEILRHPAASDEVRRAAESKLLRHYYRLMNCLSRNVSTDSDVKSNDKKPQAATGFPENLFDESEAQQSLPTKEEVRAKVEDLVKGMVLLKVEDEGAWTTLLEWTDVDSLEGYDLDFLHSFILSFPLSPVATLISGFLKYFGFPGPNAEEEEKARRAKRRAETRAREASSKKGIGKDAAEQDAEDDTEDLARRQSERDRDPFALLLAGFEGCPKLAFAHRVTSEAHLREADYANAISVAEKGISLTRAIEVETGKKLPSARAALDVTLGTALVHYYAPKHHPRALQLLDGVLKQNPKATACLMGKGYIYLGESRFSEAREQFEQALEIEKAKRQAPDQTPTNVQLEATECVGWCMIKERRLDEGRTQLLEVVDVLNKDESRNLDSARVWTRIGQAEWEMQGDHREEAHEHWLTALKRFPNYAPAFTAIGIWYLEYASPPDEDRASKCFQKAFELDATEAEAARRLATGYANEGEWALVNLIAKRVMEGEGGLEGGLSSGDKASNNTKFLPTNAWAWKAVGAYEMVNRKYTQAAQAFQVALRAEDKDPALWTRLGEAYAKSGKQVAALKALRKTLDISPDSWICYYHIASVQHELGLDQQAIDSLRKVMKLNPDQTGVAVKLAALQLSLGKQQRHDGFRARARINLIAAILTLQPIITAKLYRPTIWKTFGEICIHLSYTCKSEEDVKEAMEAILPVITWLQKNDANGSSDVKGVVVLKELVGTTDLRSRDILKAGTSAYAYRADLLKYDTKIPEIALYDLACALHLLANDSSTDNAAERDAAINAATLNIKKALDIDPTSPTLWNAFGSVSASGSPQLAQHAFIVALELEPKNAIVWCNLGFLWLVNSDYELAQQAFAKAKIIEPESALAWLGQGLIARRENNDLEAQACFAQAVMLSGGSMLIAALGNSKLLFEPLIANALSDIAPDFHALHQASFAMDRYCSAYPQDSSAMLLHGLMLERLSQFDIAISRLTTAVDLLETEYEAAESEEVEQRYAIALVNLGRINLAQGDYSASIETLDNCLGLISAREDNAATLMRIQAKTGLALAHAALEQIVESLEAFQEALSEADTLKLRDAEKEALKERISVSLAKTLWSIGGDEAFETAKTRLLESFAAEHHSATAMVSLSSIALLTNDEALTEAVIAEADDLDSEALAGKDPHNVLRYFKALWELHRGDLPAAKRVLSKSTHSAPAAVLNRGTLAELLTSYGSLNLAQAILAGGTGEMSSDTANIMRLKGLAAETAAETEREVKGPGLSSTISSIQKSILLQPWSADAWQSLAHVVL